MNITVTFRKMDASAAIKAYAGEKVSKLQRFLRQSMTAKVTLSLDKLRHVAEVRVSSGGRHLEAREVSDDLYASIDKVIDKLERQISGAKGVTRAKARRSGQTLRGGTEPKPLGAAVSAEGVVVPKKKRAAKTAPKSAKAAKTVKARATIPSKKEVAPAKPPAPRKRAARAKAPTRGVSVRARRLAAKR